LTPDDPQGPASTEPAEPVAQVAGEAANPVDGAADSAPRPPHRRRRRRRRGPPRAAALETSAPAGDAPADPPAGDGPTVEMAPAARLPGENTLRLRTRPPRRRHRPPPAVQPAGASEGTPEAAATAEGGEASPATPPAPSGPRLGPDGQPLRRRRRRRRPPQLGGAGERTAEGEAGAEATAPPARDPNRPPRRRNHRPRGDRPGDRPGDRRGESTGERAATSVEPTPREGRGDRDRRSAVGRGPRDGDRRRDGTAGRRDRRDGKDGRGRGRDDRPKKVERKLYTMDSVVDRGFEDVEDESGSRRVHWTIVKRTIADQISRKPMSQNYVLQRDGVDSEFPSLGAARDAVNKKIVHPEKLTLSKAEHAAQKGGR